jgi:hypothetical protein
MGSGRYDAGFICREFFGTGMVEIKNKRQTAVALALGLVLGIVVGSALSGGLSGYTTVL